MPYITDKRRRELAGDVSACERIVNPGELNYIITLLVRDYVDRKGLSYQHINDVLGALEGAKLEFYRRVAAPYENEKLQANGDVY